MAFGAAWQGCVNAERDLPFAKDRTPGKWNLPGVQKTSSGCQYHPPVNTEAQYDQAAPKPTAVLVLEFMAEDTVAFKTPLRVNR